MHAKAKNNVCKYKLSQGVINRKQNVTLSAQIRIPRYSLNIEVKYIPITHVTAHPADFGTTIGTSVK